VKAATVRFYFDADILGLAKVVAGLRSDVTYPGDPGAVIHKRNRPPCPITPRHLDTEWLPVAANAGWLIVTRDAHIRSHTAEIATVLACKAKLVSLATRESGGTWGQLEVLMTQWRRIEDLAELPGPFVYELFRTAPPKKIA
jgi:hypothetical protein